MKSGLLILTTALLGSLWLARPTFAAESDPWREVAHDGGPSDSLALPATALEPDQVSAATVFGPDDRKPVADTTVPGWRSVVYLGLYDATNQPLGSCSGIALNYNVVLTAAHCIYEAGAFVPKMLVVPGATPTTAPFGTVVATAYSVPKGWADGVGKLSGDGPVPPSPYDVGLVYLPGRPFGDALGPYFPIAAAPDAYFGSDVKDLVTAGFPGDKPVGSMWFAHSIDFTLDADYLYTDIDIIPGQSGSPIWSIGSDGYGYIFSVVSGGNEYFNRSVRFTTPVVSALGKYCKSYGCEIGDSDYTHYSLTTTTLCRTSLTCNAGPEPIRAGAPVSLAFTLDKRPLMRVRAEVYWNGALALTASWSPPPPPGNVRYYMGEPALVPTMLGKVEVRVYVGDIYVGSYSGDVGPPVLAGAQRFQLRLPVLVKE